MLPRSMGLRGTVVPPSMMQHVMLLGRYSSMRFSIRSYRSLPPRPSDHRILGELELSHHAPSDVRAYPIDPVASDGGFHLRDDGAVVVTLSDEPQLLAVNLVPSNGSQAPIGHYPVDMLPQSDLPSVEEQRCRLQSTGPSPGWGGESRAW